MPFWEHAYLVRSHVARRVIRTLQVGPRSYILFSIEEVDMYTNWKLLALLAGLALAMSANVFGQASAINGEINGTVTDPSGAAISNATVQIGNTDTGFKLSTKTGESGLYRFTVLPLGTYKIAVQAPGFATDEQTAPGED